MRRFLSLSAARATALLFVLIGGLILASALIPPVPVPAAAQGGSVCPPVVTRALASVGTVCDRLGRNSACYGFQSVSATFAQPQPTGFFSRVGDTAGLTTLQTIRTAPLDLARNLWGVALMNVQASLPNTLPGQAVTFLLLGDAEIENAVAPADAFRGGIPVNVRTIAPTALYQQPNTSALIVATVEANTPLPADARTESGWYRVASGGQYGWVEAIALTVPAPAARLPIYTPGTSSTPMQAFFLRTGAGAPVCSDAPDALIVQGPQNLTVDLTVNGADLRVGSTVVIRTIPDLEPDGSVGTSQTPGSNLEISVLDGQVLVNPDTDQEVVIDEGQTASTCLFDPANLGVDAEQNDQVVDPACPWTEPEPITNELLNSLILLDQFTLQYPIPVQAQPVPPTPTPPSQPEPATAVPPLLTLPPPPTIVPPTVIPPTFVPPTLQPTPTATGTFVPGAIDLTFTTATVSDSTIPPADILLTYRLRNIGGIPATNIRVDGIVPVGALYGFNDTDDFFPRSSSGRSMDTLDIAPGNFWLLPILEPGVTAEITIGLEFKDGSAGESFTTNPIITADQPDFNPANDGGSITFGVESFTNLAVTIAPISPISEGSTTGFTITVENLGSEKAENVSIPLVFSGGLTPLPGSPPSLGSYDSVSRVWTIPTLNPGENATFFGLIQAAPGSGATTQTVSATIGAAFLTDFTPANNSASQSFTVTAPSVDLAVTSISTFNPPIDEGALTYFITYTIENLGSGMATGVTVSDLLPATTGATFNSGFDLVFVSASDPGYDFTTDTWTVGTLASGGILTLTLRVDVEPSAYGQTYIANPTITQTQLDDDPANNVGLLSLVIPAVTVDLGFDGLNVVNMPYREGDTIFITHTIRNFDPDRPSGELTLTTPLPFGVAFSSYSGPGSYDSDSASLFIPSIAANSAINASFTVTINPGTAYTNLTRTATINAAGDSTPGNNSQLVSFFVSARGDLGVTVGSTTTTPLVGVPFDVTYTVTNNGPSVVAGIELPINLAGLTPGTPLPSQGTVNLVTGVWTVGSLASGGNATLTLPLTAPPVTAGVPQGVTGGTVTGSSNTDNTSGNNNTSITITPAGVVCDPSGIASAAALITAIENANNEILCAGPNTITLGGGLISFAASYDGTNALPPITSSITINGNVTNLSAGVGGFRLLTIAADGVLQLNRVRINSFNLLTSDGGAIVMNGLAGSKFLNVTLNNNTGVNGGAIYHGGSSGVLTLVNVTLFDNSASGGSGSAIFAASSGNVDVSFGTLWNFSSGGVMLAGGGGASIDLKNSIIGGLGSCMSGSLVVGNGGGNATTFGDGSCATFSTPTLSFASFAGSVGNGLPTVTFNTGTSTHFNTVFDCTDLTDTTIIVDARDLSRPTGTFCDPGAAEQL